MRQAERCRAQAENYSRLASQWKADMEESRNTMLSHLDSGTEAFNRANAEAEDVPAGDRWSGATQVRALEAELNQLRAEASVKLG
jgi:hypothetical protein